MHVKEIAKLLAQAAAHTANPRIRIELDVRDWQKISLYFRRAVRHDLANDYVSDVTFKEIK